MLSDIWDADKRGMGVGLFALAPLIGPIIGPVAGGWIVEKSTWRWCFWAVSIADVVIQLLGLCFLRESECGSYLRGSGMQLKLLI